MKVKNETVVKAKGAISLVLFCMGVTLVLVGIIVTAGGIFHFGMAQMLIETISVPQRMHILMRTLRRLARTCDGEY